MEEKLIYDERIKSFVLSHNLVDRIYDMAFYFNIIKDVDNESIKKVFLLKLKDPVYVETLAKYFEKKLSRCKKNIDLRCNLVDLVNDLNYLKQYLL